MARSINNMTRRSCKIANNLKLIEEIFQKKLIPGLQLNVLRKHCAEHTCWDAMHHEGPPVPLPTLQLLTEWYQHRGHR